MSRGAVVDLLGRKPLDAHRDADGVFLHALDQVVGDDGAGQAVAVLQRRVGDEVGGAQQPQRLQGDQFRVAGPDAEAVQDAAHQALPYGLPSRHCVTGISGRQPW